MPRASKTPPEKPASFTLIWTEVMHDVFIDTLEKQHDLGKRSDTGFKAEAWTVCCAEVQKVYTGPEIIPIDKLKSKHDHWKRRWNVWVWVGQQSGIGKDPESGRYEAADPTWENVFAKKPYAKWRKKEVLEYEQQLDKLFDDRSAIGDKAASFATGQNGKTTSDQAFASQSSSKKKTSIIDQIDEQFGVLSEEEQEGQSQVVENNHGSVTKEGNTGRAVKRKLEIDLIDDETLSSSKKKKQSPGLELAQEMKRWRQHREKEHEEQDLSKAGAEAMVLCKIKAFIQMRWTSLLTRSTDG